MSDVKKAFKGVASVLTLGLSDTLFGEEDIPGPEKPPDPTEAETAGIIAAASKSEARRRRLATQGRQSTFATTPAGIATAPNVQRKTLFGQ